MSASASRRHITTDDEPIADDLAPEQRLFRAVICEAVRDAIGLPTERPENRDVVKSRARTWFERGGADFRTVCEAAGLNPDHVRKEMLAFFEGHRPVTRDLFPKSSLFRKHRNQHTKRQPANDE
ncbi:hypothetical protein [Sphingosinicella sp.]|uniref:hypothetical protein n=1 Tax=Sphingosinicella sp. TaxID=1917971 RepID=UPI0017D6FDA2|nr:hypothetical protein [Sphingosinicella sp.]MBA4757405.1 hypothetical protein [Sphingosinicella sp.]